MQVADASARVCVVLWNALCVEWYRRLHPGMVLRLSRFRVRESFGHRTGQNTEPDIGTVVCFSSLQLRTVQLDTQIHTTELNFKMHNNRKTNVKMCISLSLHGTGILPI